MKFEVILRVQETKYSEKVDKYRCCCSEERWQYVFEKYEHMRPIDAYNSWVLVNLLTDDGEFERIIV